jgi:hypothetical protein
MELRVLNLNCDLARVTIGKERAALFRHYRVVSRKQRPDAFFGRVKRDDTHSVSVLLHPDNGR